MPALAAYGWDDRWDAEFGPHRDAGLVPGRVARVDRGRCDVVGDLGVLKADCSGLASRAGSAGRAGPAFEAGGTRGDMLHAPCTGDWAALRLGGDTPVVVALLPRRTALVRSAPSRRSEGQVLAANIDVVAIVVPLADAPPSGDETGRDGETRAGHPTAGQVLKRSLDGNVGDLARVERLLALAWESGAQPLLVLTKADQVAGADAEAVRTEVAAVAPGVDVVTTSAVSGEGMDVLAALCTEGTVVVVGRSGAGKSSLVNALMGTRHQAVEVVRRDGKGRHTSVRRELLPLPGGGVLIDTPGLRGIGLWAAEDGLNQAFSDIDELAGRCRFDDCEHRTEPGCAVLAAVDAGVLPARRLDSYRKLARESSWEQSRTDARLRAERERYWKTIAKAQRRLYRQRGH